MRGCPLPNSVLINTKERRRPIYLYVRMHKFYWLVSRGTDIQMGNALNRHMLCTRNACGRAFGTGVARLRHAFYHPCFPIVSAPPCTPCEDKNGFFHYRVGCETANKSQGRPPDWIAKAMFTHEKQHTTCTHYILYTRPFMRLILQHYFFGFRNTWKDLETLIIFVYW